MTLQEALQAIRPGFTLYGVLLTFAIISFTIGRHFWNYEKLLLTDNIDRLKALMEGFRHLYIEPIITEKINKAMLESYEKAIIELKADLFEKDYSDPAEIRFKLIADDILKDMVSESALNERISNFNPESTESVKEFLSSASAIEFLDKMDRAYGGKTEITNKYYKACAACMRTSYAFISLAFVLLIGILQILVTWHEMVLLLWVVILLETLIYGIYSFIKLEVNRRSLIRLWENLQLYGKI